MDRDTISGRGGEKKTEPLTMFGGGETVWKDYTTKRLPATIYTGNYLWKDPHCRIGNEGSEKEGDVPPNHTHTLKKSQSFYNQ